MTKIEWLELKDICYIRVEGHAEYNPGNDIVCAAVSALMQTLYAGLDGVCHASAGEKHEDGMMVVVVYTDRENEKAVHTLFQSILLGLQLIAGEYPEHVQIEPMTESIGGVGEILFQMA